MSWTPRDPITSTVEFAETAKRFLAYVHDLDKINTAQSVWIMVDELMRILDNGQTLRDGLWPRVNQMLNELTEGFDLLGGPEAKAARYLANAVRTAPHSLHADGRFYFLSSYLTAWKRLETADFDEASKIAKGAVEYGIYSATAGHEAGLYRAWKDGWKTPPESWPDTGFANPSASRPVLTNMLNSLLPFQRHIGSGGTDRFADDLLRRMKEFVADPRFKGEPACLIAAEDPVLMPADFPWAWQGAGQRYIASLKDGYPEDIWPEFRP